MDNYIQSSTFNKFHKEILADFLDNIFARFPNYCIDRTMQHDLYITFEEYKRIANIHMGSPKLDRHKLASCMCGAIIEVQPIRILSNRQLCPKRANEMFALFSGLGIVKDFMMYDVLNKISSFKERQSVKCYLRDNFNILLPTLDDKICDTQEYTENLYNALLWTHNKCDYKTSECYHYDIWSYATIFYHIEVRNRDSLKKLCEIYYKEQNP